MKFVKLIAMALILASALTFVVGCNDAKKTEDEIMNKVSEIEEILGNDEDKAKEEIREDIAKAKEELATVKNEAKALETNESADIHAFIEKAEESLKKVETSLEGDLEAVKETAKSELDVLKEDFAKVKAEAEKVATNAGDHIHDHIRGIENAIKEIEEHITGK